MFYKQKTSEIEKVQEVVEVEFKLPQQYVLETSEELNKLFSNFRDISGKITVGWTTFDHFKIDLNKTYGIEILSLVCENWTDCTYDSESDPYTKRISICETQDHYFYVFNNRFDDFGYTTFATEAEKIDITDKNEVSAYLNKLKQYSYIKKIPQGGNYYEDAESAFVFALSKFSSQRFHNGDNKPSLFKDAESPIWIKNK